MEGVPDSVYMLITCCIVASLMLHLVFCHYIHVLDNICGDFLQLFCVILVVFLFSFVYGGLLSCTIFQVYLTKYCWIILLNSWLIRRLRTALIILIILL